MTTSFTRLPITASNQALAVVPRADIDFLTTYDPTTYEHWQFGGGATCLTGPVGGRVLTPQAGVIYATNHITLNTLAGNALLTPLDESASMIRTVCAVFRDPATTGAHMIFGSLGATAEANGGGTWISGTTPSRGIFSTYRTLNNAVSVKDNALANNWYFVATSIDLSAATKKLKNLVGGSAGYELNTTTNYVVPTAGRKLTLGGSYYTSAAAGTMDFAEFMVFDGQALSLADLQAVYASRKTKLAARGIAVV